MVQNGKVQASVRAARLMLSDNCSLVISSVTAEDAGRYTCRQNGDTLINLNVLKSKSLHF